MSPFKQLSSIEEINKVIDAHPFVFLYITTPYCSVCHGLKPQIEAILDNYPKIYCATVDASEIPEVAGRFEIFTVPVLLLFVHGKEYIREARIVHTEKFEEKVSRIYEHVESESF